MGDRSGSPTGEYAVRIPASFVPSLSESFIQPTPLRNLHKEFMEMSEEMQVYVRIKPSKDSGSILSVDGNHILVNPPRDSLSSKNRNNAGAKTVQKFKFNKIYDSTINQELLFKDSVLNLVQEFLSGKSTLLFTYGATSAGKTYTMLGNVKDAGLLPRSLDVIFNSLEGKMLKSPILKPLAVNDVMKLNHIQADAEEMEKFLLMRGFDMDSSDPRETSSTSTSLKDWNVRARDTTVCSLQHPDDCYSVWVSYCEIYNEQVFDLLEGCDKRRKRSVLRVTEDRKGKFYVKGLKEVCVRTADEAVRVLLFGKENLHFATTKLNHNSSRSHCVFTVKVIRTNDMDEPTEAVLNMMSFVDLAGMERTTKTQSRGDRLKEAGNINTSLMVLGRCIDAMKSNQQLNKMLIPYRESKLTRILQTYFSGQGRAAMFLNISPSVLLCEETLHVLKFGALAQEVIIQPEQSNSEVSMFAPPIRPSKFQQYVRKSISMLSARASVLEVSAFQPVGEEDEDEEKLQDRITYLEEELARLRSEWNDNEQKIRNECCDEWTEIYTRLDENWRQRYEETKAQYEEFCENRVDLMTQLMNKQVAAAANSSRKKKRVDDCADAEDSALKDLEINDLRNRVGMLEDSNKGLTELVTKLRHSLKVSEESKSDLQQEMTRLQLEMAASNKPKIFFSGPEDIAETDPGKMHHANDVAKLQALLDAKEEMLNEAVVEFHAKDEQLSKAQQENELLRKEIGQMSEEMDNIKSQLEKSNLLLSDANERLDVREEELVNLEEKLSKANGQFCGVNTELREAKRRIRELESRVNQQGDNEAIYKHCDDLQKQVLEANTRLERRGVELEDLKQELSQWKSRAEDFEETRCQLDKLTRLYNKSQTQLECAQKEVASLKEANEELRTRRESLLDEVGHLKRDMELLSSERKCEESSQAQLIEENKQMRQTADDMIKLTAENNEFRTALAEYESTVKDLMSEIERLKTSQRDRRLLEEELETLASTLGRMQIEKGQLEKEMQDKSEKIEKDNEKLTKEMLQHMRRADELAEKFNMATEKLNEKSRVNETLVRRVAELEREKEEESKPLKDALISKENEIEAVRRENQLELENKNAEVLRLETELKSLLSGHEERRLQVIRLEAELKALLTGHVDYKKPLMTIKAEKNTDDEQSHDENICSMVTPTPVKARRGRTQKISSPEPVQKDADITVDTIGSSSRPRRTIKSADVLLAPPSSTKSSARKPRKTKQELEDVAHPALSGHSPEEPDTAQVTPLPASHNSKRRLYNAKCPDVLLPSANKDDNSMDIPKRMATRSRKQ